MVFMHAFPHISVLLDQVLKGFENTHLRVFIDGTLGAGGHAAALLEAHPEIECYIGIDQDPAALVIAAERLKPWEKKVHLRHGNFIQFEQFLKELCLENADGILVDLGVSSMQLDQPERGFSFMRDGPLDMRMNPENTLNAAIIVNEWTENDIAKIIRDYGEEKKWRLAARAIVHARQQQPILTTSQLAEVLKSALGHFSKKAIHPCTLTFQALRICVNKELDVLENFLSKSMEALNPKGRLAVISFHSLEDRIVKNQMRFAASDKWDTVGIGGIFRDKDPLVELVTKKPLIATDEECEKNPRSRSAKLRVVEKIG